MKKFLAITILSTLTITTFAQNVDQIPAFPSGHMCKAGNSSEIIISNFNKNIVAIKQTLQYVPQYPEALEHTKFLQDLNTTCLQVLTSAPIK